MATRKSKKGERYSAKLLFQYRVVVGGKSNVMRTCEERMIVLHARNAQAALASAKRSGKLAEFKYDNDDSNPVYFEFVGILDLLCLGVECREDEVWYDIKVIKQPKERRKLVLPNESKLNAIYWANVRNSVKRAKQSR
jgi:hypothetical protein